MHAKAGLRMGQGVVAWGTLMYYSPKAKKVCENSQRPNVSI
jgi:hypothetical protein